MVRLENLERGVWYKNVNISGTVGLIYFILDTIYLRVCPTTRWHHLCGDDVTAVCTGAQNISRVCFLAENKERYNLEWFLSVFLDVQCPAYCNPVVFSLLWCEKIDLLLFIENKISLRQESFIPALPPWFIMKTAWHFQVDFITQLFIKC